jgi:hypothetical protein
MTLNFRTEFLASTFYEKNLVASMLLIKYSLYGPGDKSREKIKTSLHFIFHSLSAQERATRSKFLLFCTEFYARKE